MIRPAEENHGIKFRRIDLPGTQDIPALFKRVVDTSLATVLGVNGAIVSTIEHLMASFAGLGIDNAWWKWTTMKCPSWTEAPKSSPGPLPLPAS